MTRTIEIRPDNLIIKLSTANVWAFDIYQALSMFYIYLLSLYDYSIRYDLLKHLSLLHWLENWGVRHVKFCAQGQSYELAESDSNVTAREPLRYSTQVIPTDLKQYSRKQTSIISSCSHMRAPHGATKAERGRRALLPALTITHTHTHTQRYSGLPYIFSQFYFKPLFLKRYPMLWKKNTDTSKTTIN